MYNAIYIIYVKACERLLPSPLDLLFVYSLAAPHGLTRAVMMIKIKSSLSFAVPMTMCMQNLEQSVG